MAQYLLCPYGISADLRVDTVQAAPAAGRPWEAAPGLQVGGEAWSGGRPQAAVAQHHQSHDSAHDRQSTSG